MLYLNDSHIREAGVDWEKLTGIAEDAVRAMDHGEYAAPLKTYLRFPEPGNRIIATPAYLGGPHPLAGIKWIAGFPGNIKNGQPRAHNAIVLNDSENGLPLAFLRCNLLNGLRAAAVSGIMLRAYAGSRPDRDIRLGIIGWGPIGRLHLDMCAALLGSRLKEVMLYDLRDIDMQTVPDNARGMTAVAADWRELCRRSNVIATCTVSAERYIDEPPAPGSLLLNVSLRDFRPEGVAGIRAVFVDDWREVCRENTDIERLHLRHGLQEEDVRTLADLVCRDALAEFPGETVFFNPMGLGIFDIAIAGHYYREAMKLGLGIELP
ncbi:MULTISPECIES: 2,3-diaminopropionate biosynthesis protein SbnB [unclassified Paenibacillus]|uniref:2,3-diaminopropionate biosynthesis protein SbnB n=1 Tax=unclassified Paenibacillus TaxID=185978 RepID=UPI0009547032|nr:MULTISPECIES: 2,3-diaminopropionate biosynthesis protein SbnB [unclassified Paenibacillus]ASS67906.1 2,3-diaminopropionate biosynthesis protein SbnB [Paenibacillus sp. RUD330]SIR44367.1 ornithine cyclodeaminase [Paenibacillus sp. RU4X]SIR54135.1 ornithine cyclodeaminase [Paenibacillus sp. RU4T]